MSVASDPDIARAYAGVLAASNALVARHTRPRDISPAEIPAGYTPSGLRDTPSLLDPNGPAGEQGSAALRLARVTAASIIYTLEAPTEREAAHVERLKPGGFTEKLLTQNELARCRSWGDDKSTETEQVCHYCRLLSALFHENGAPLEVEPINHNARIETDFDSNTNISEAGIKDYLLFVPTELASKILRQSHPLQWKASAPDLFELVAAAKPTGEKPFAGWEPDPSVDEAAWEKSSVPGPNGETLRYIYEVASFPWNPQVTSKIENVIKMINFKEAGSSKESLYSLRFDYSLESCIRSNYGITWEEHGGLNVDDGMFEGTAFDLDQIDASHLERLTEDNLEHWIGSLNRRIAAYDDQDRWHISEAARRQATVRNAGLKALRTALVDGELHWEDWRVEAVQRMGRALSALWNRPVCLLRVSASKRLRYTVPSNGPVDIWALLTYLAPGLLFVFINRAVCQVPHFLLLSGALSPKTEYPEVDLEEDGLGWPSYGDVEAAS